MRRHPAGAGATDASCAVALETTAGAMRAISARGRSKLNADPARKDWVHVLRYHHAVALFESGKSPEARNLFDRTFLDQDPVPDDSRIQPRRSIAARMSAAIW